MRVHVVAPVTPMVALGMDGSSSSYQGLGSILVAQPTICTAEHGAVGVHVHLTH